MIITLDYALKIGKILVNIGGANSRILEKNSDFILYLTENSRFGHEYRFMGHLGSGGKFYSSRREWRVNCYQESETVMKLRLKIIDQINGELKNLYKEYKNDKSRTNA